MNQNTLASLAGLLGRALILFGVAALLLIAVAVLMARAGAELFYWGNPAALRVHRTRRRISADFGITMSRLHHDGTMRIAPTDTETFARQHFQEELTQLLKTPVRVELANGTVRFTTPVTIPTPLPGTVTFNGKAFTIGKNVDTGMDETIHIAGTSLTVLAGNPGSGKTVLLDQLMAAAKTFSPATTVINFDGKDRRKQPESTDLKPLPELFDDLLNDAEQVVHNRLRTRHNRWHDPDPGVYLLIIDEAQVLFTGVTKAEKQAIEARQQKLRYIVSQGREAAVHVILATQRPTTDSVPSPIRALAGINIAGRLQSQVSVEATMGRRVEPGVDPNPTQITQAGRFVVDDGTGSWRLVQAYTPEEEMLAS